MIAEALDPGIRRYVEVLRAAGVETFESCEGGEGHTFPEPTIRFHGQRDEGFHALAVALQHAYPVSNLRRVWSIEDGEPVGPNWELTFYRQATFSPADLASYRARAERYEKALREAEGELQRAAKAVRVAANVLERESLDESCATLRLIQRQLETMVARRALARDSEEGND